MLSFLFISNFIFINLSSLFILLFNTVILNYDLFEIQFLLLVIIVNLGFSIIGTITFLLFSKVRGKEILSPMLFIPLISPLLMGGSILTNQIIQNDIKNISWFGLIIAYDLLFFLVGFFCGVGVLITLYFFFFKKNKRNLNEENDIVSLKQHMQSIQQSLQNFNLAQDRLENTLVRGGSQQQGSWGEFVLKNILDGVGLREGYEYETQKAFRDEEGNLQKPDVIVHMPGKRDIVIDSKVSLSSWHEFSNSNNENEKKTYLKKFIDSVKNFVRDLGKDDYASLYQINSIDSVLMFIPIEPALLTLYNEAGDIIEKAWQKKIIIVGPSTLPFLLKAVENMWRIDKQSKTIKDIAATASEIYDKAVNVYESFSTVKQSLDKASLKMDEAKSRLQDGPGSLTKKIDKMKKLGRLNTKKQLPEDSENAID